MNCTDWKINKIPVADITVSSELLNVGDIVAMTHKDCGYNTGFIKEVLFSKSSNLYSVVDNSALEKYLLEATDIKFVLRDKGDLRIIDNDKYWAFVNTNMENPNLYRKGFYVRLKSELDENYLYEIIEVDDRHKTLKLYPVIGDPLKNWYRIVDFYEVSEIIHWTYAPEIEITKLNRSNCKTYIGIGGYEISDKTVSIRDIKPGDIVVNGNCLEFVVVTNVYINPANKGNLRHSHIEYFVSAKDSLSGKAATSEMCASNFKYKLSFKEVAGDYSTTGHLEKIVFE